MSHSFHPGHAPGRRLQRGVAPAWVFLGFLLVAGFFFFTEHRAHLIGALPYLLLGLCPLLHLFHGRHGGHGGHHGDDAPRTEAGAGPTGTPPGAPQPPHRH